MTTQEELYQGLLDAIEELQSKEVQAKEPIERAFHEYCEPANKVFDERTKELQEKAKEQLKPAKAALDDKVHAITRAAGRKVEALVKKYSTYQKTIEKQFYDNAEVKEALREKEETIRAEKLLVQRTLDDISSDTDKKIAALKAVYEEEAKKLDQ